MRNECGEVSIFDHGEDKFNSIAAEEGGRLHGATLAAASSGDGFPMALKCARLLGGTLRLKLLKDEMAVIAVLRLPRVSIVAAPDSNPKEILVQAAADEPITIRSLRYAIIDDSATIRKMLLKKIELALPPSRDSLVAGASCESIDAFDGDVARVDADIVFVDMNFGVMHHKIVEV